MNAHFVECHGAEVYSTWKVAPWLEPENLPVISHEIDRQAAMQRMLSATVAA
jgi:hypothetical protein